MAATPAPTTTKQPGDRVICPRCGRILVLVRRNGVWACDPGTTRRHACLRTR